LQEVPIGIVQHDEVLCGVRNLEGFVG
jgi:hypothetical protein